MIDEEEQDPLDDIEDEFNKIGQKSLE